MIITYQGHINMIPKGVFIDTFSFLALLNQDGDKHFQQAGYQALFL